MCACVLVALCSKSQQRLQVVWRETESGARVVRRRGVERAVGAQHALATSQSKAIGDLLSDRERLDKCAEAGRTAVEETFNIQQMAEAYLERLAKLG